MATPLRKVDAGMLRIGMYVSQLDRPWLETPFLFQGFYIRTENEIADLQRYCEFVHIDIEQSDATMLKKLDAVSQTQKDKSNKTASASSKPSLWARIKAFFTGKKIVIQKPDPAPGEFYKDTASTADELVVARTLHSGALQQCIKLLDSIRKGDEIPMPDLEIVAGAMVDSVLRNSTALALLARMQEKDEYTGAHSLETSIWALVFGRHLGLDRESLAALGLGALLLDVGKTKLPETLLEKQGPITEDERLIFNQHVGHSLEIIRKAKGSDRRIIDMVATHHERYDGSGYPRGWKGNQIPVFGRIAGIVDSYAAMTNDRPYAKAMSSYDAMREFKANSDKLFQSEMVEQFIQAIGIFPTGTLVELNTGEVGIVLKEFSANRLRPELALILDAQKNRLEKFRVLDLSKQRDESPEFWIERGVKVGSYDIDASEFFL